MTRTAKIIACFTVVFAVARLYMSPADLMTLMNGLFFGSVVSLLFVMRTLAWNSFIGQVKYRDVSVFTLGLLLVVAGVALWVGTSAFLRAADITSPTYTAFAVAKYAVICGFLTMAYSPDIGVGLLTGRDRQAIALSVVAGLLVAGVVVYMQEAAVFAI